MTRYAYFVTECVAALQLHTEQREGTVELTTLHC